MALGLNATAYSFFNAYVVKPAAVHDPGTLYQASWENRGGFVHRFSMCGRVLSESGVGT